MMRNKITDFKSFYLIGIGGIGMSALARYFKSNDKAVFGYDRTTSTITDDLIKEGCKIHFEDKGSDVRKIVSSPEETLVIYTPAVSSSHKELTYFRENGFVVYKRAEALGLITRFMKGLCVAGTHGKTTTSAMLSHILDHSPWKCNAFLGGISSNKNSNLIVNKSTDWVVVEADEFDRSFLHLSPFASIVTAMDPDHLDIYGDAKNFTDGFRQYAMKIDPNGCCVVHEGINLPSLCDSVTYAIDSDTADYKASHIKYIDGVMQFIVNSKSINHTKFTLQIPGLHNVLNALACIALLDKIGLTIQEIQGGLNSFKGVRRRFDIQFKSDNLIYIDDYAHHPEELRFLIDSLQMMFPEQEITAIFQPHLYTRTRDFGSEFSEQLSRFDELILLPIYPAREEEILGISSEWLLSMVRLKKKQVLNSSRILELMQKKDSGIVVTIGAGDIDRMVAPLKDILIQNVDAVS